MSLPTGSSNSHGHLCPPPCSTQVLTKDLERHAAELQVQEGLPLDGEPIINVPLIHAR